MALQRDTKRAKAMQQVLAVKEAAKIAHMAAIVWYRNLTVEQMHKLRIAARTQDVYVKVIRNRLAHRALEGSNFVCLQPVLKGPVLLAFSLQKPNAVARLLRDFSKDHQDCAVKYLAFEGQLLEGKDLDIIADLPTKEEAMARLLAVLKSPVQKLLYILKEPTARLSRTLAALENRK